MRAIQFILIPILLITVFIYFANFRSRLFGRLILIAIGIVGVLLVLAPDVAQKTANLLGVGRGTDLILYLGFLGLAFVCSLLFTKLRHLDNHVTELARTIALMKASHPDD